MLEIQLDRLTYLFDASPTTYDLAGGDDRLVAVWGESQPPASRRDFRRQAGFLRSPAKWSGARRDRGHFVAHAAGGGLDLNLFPQISAVNRGRTMQGRRWREMERYASLHSGTPLFVRPIYDGTTWVPSAVDYGLLADGELWFERFDNSP